MEAKQVPLIELLEKVPANARLEIHDPDGMGTKFIPVGKMCHEAITALRAAIEQRKPVAWRKHYENSGYTYFDERWKNIPPDAEPLYL